MLGESPDPEPSLDDDRLGHRLRSDHLRASADRYPQDACLIKLLADLTAGSAEFRELWDSNPVSAPGHRTKTMLHPDLGRLEINCDILTIPEDDQQVVFMAAEPDSPTGKAFEQLH